MADSMTTNVKPDTFVKTARNLRWLVIAAILIGFPLGTPQTYYVYALLGVTALFNGLFYLFPSQKFKVLWSPVTSLVFDSLLACALIALAGTQHSPLSVLLIFTIVSAAYLYSMKGAAIVVIAEVALLFVATTYSPFPAIQFDSYRYIGVLLYMFLLLGFYVERLTHQERIERNLLKNLTENSEEQRMRLAALVDSLDVAVFVTDHKGSIMVCNQAARALADVQAELEKQEFLKVLPVFKRIDPKMEPVNIFNQTASSQHRRDLSIKGKNTDKIDLDISVTPVVSDNAITEYIIVCEDISQERTLDEERMEFVSVAAHELRTPIAIIEAAVGSVISLEKSLSQQGRDLLEQARRNTVELANIIKDLSILSEAQNDNVPVDIAEINPTKLVEGCVEDFHLLAQEKGLTLKQEYNQDTPLIFSTEQHIREILQNYLTNAIKYSEKGTITIKAERAKSDGVVFSVHDEGIGISPSDQQMLFTKFFRAESYLTRVTGGTGLGLYLCMELAERMGAKLWCKSAPGEGSTFYLEVPMHSTLKRDREAVMNANVASLIDDL
jgi:signal transduction histidine kinase